MLLVEDYTVVFNNGTEIEFYPSGEWKEVKSRGTEIPAKIIPSGIAQYVSQNYNGHPIKKISKKRYGYEVELGSESRFFLFIHTHKELFIVLCLPYSVLDKLHSFH